MTKVLIAEDEERIASFLRKGFESNGFATEVVEDGLAAIDRARDVEFDLLVLDLGLPECDGLQVLSEIRARGERLPVIILTANDEVDTTVAGLEGGADDYMTKPFSFEELLARARLRLRQAEEAEPGFLHAGPMTLDLHRHCVKVGEEVIDLPGREFALAEVLFRHPGEVLSRQQLLEAVWGEDADPASKKLEVYILYLRRKLGDEVIENIRGRGYRLRPPDPVTAAS
ncbi:MAG TPA: response regulator transcription factor [Acidimicrobiales bacterium]|nr:response regulator transcription factor [Acidimicrobiales bacterium]